jgi:hypothetical protein
MWLQLRSNPTGEAKDNRQSLLSVDSFSYLVLADTVLGKSSVSESVCRHSLLCNKQILNRHFSVKLNRHIKVETIGL